MTPSTRRSWHYIRQQTMAARTNGVPYFAVVYKQLEKLGCLNPANLPPPPVYGLGLGTYLTWNFISVDTYQSNLAEDVGKELDMIELRTYTRVVSIQPSVLSGPVISVGLDSSTVLIWLETESVSKEVKIAALF
uniref:Uncharacterized protein n=1 Tax=Timema poppense TaxID=170557 RepID=A0A7R9CP15_TIMPO|nr:unnamed protein product [Timema poppensis]